VTPAQNLPEFVCPRCHGPLDEGIGQYMCRPCSATYPIVLGIPDFRVNPDPWIGLDDDRTKAIRLDAIVRNRSFRKAVRAYWEITPHTPRPLVERYVQNVLDSESRASDWLNLLAMEERPAADGCWIDIGCGTGNLVAAGAHRGITVVGVDVALRWLVVARRREVLQGSTAQLVCANAEYLPFKPQAFVRAVSLGTLEHCEEPEKVMREAKRVLRSGTVLRIRTVNRYSLMREPHVQVWGVGFVPRSMADAYVQKMNGQRYLHHRPVSPRELSRDLRNAGFSEVSVHAAEMLSADRVHLGRMGSLAAPVYDRARTLALIGGMVRWMSPMLEARGVAI